MIQLGVKEVLLPLDEKGSDYDLKKLRTIVERCNIVTTDRKKCECDRKALSDGAKTMTHARSALYSRLHRQGRRAGLEPITAWQPASFDET